MPAPFYDPSSTDATIQKRSHVRLIIRDTVEEKAIFSDAEIDVYLELNAGNKKLAAADALDTIASQTALLEKVRRVGNIEIDGAKLADALRAHAKSLRLQVSDAAKAAEETQASEATSFSVSRYGSLFL